MCYMANACAFVLDQRSHRRYKLYAMPPSAEHMPARCGRTCAFAWLCEHMIRERLPSTFRRRQGPLLLPCSSCAARICVHPLYVRRPIAVWRARLVGRRQSSKGRQRGGRQQALPGNAINSCPRLHMITARARHRQRRLGQRTRTMPARGGFATPASRARSAGEEGMEAQEERHLDAGRSFLTQRPAAADRLRPWQAQLAPPPRQPSRVVSSSRQRAKPWTNRVLAKLGWLLAGDNGRRNGGAAAGQEPVRGRPGTTPACAGCCSR